MANTFQNKCFAHVPNVSGNIKPFTDKTWDTFLRGVNVWKDLVGHQAEIAKAFVRNHAVANNVGDVHVTLLHVPIPEIGGCHPICYKYFTDSTKQTRAKVAKEKQELSAGSCSISGKL